MDVKLLLDMVKELQKNALSIVVFMVLLIGIVLIASRIIKSIIDNFNKRIDSNDKTVNDNYSTLKDEIKNIKDNMQIVLAAVPAMEKFNDNIEKVQKLFKLIDRASNIKDYYEKEFEYIRESFKKNYQNGSKEEKASNDVAAAYSNVIDALTKDNNINNTIKDRYIILSDVIRELLIELYSSIQTIKEVPIKMKLIDIWINNLYTILDVFELKVHTTYNELSDDKLKQELRIKFHELDNSKINRYKTIDIENIFGVSGVKKNE